jgi:hypothetical protein
MSYELEPSASLASAQLPAVTNPERHLAGIKILD